MHRIRMDGWRFRERRSAAWSIVSLPHNFPAAACVYKRSFVLGQEQMEKNPVILIEDLPSDSTVFVNGRKVFSRAGKKPFASVSLAGFARLGENMLRIEASSSLRGEAWLVVKEPVFSPREDIWIETVSLHPARICVHSPRECTAFVLDGFDLVDFGFGKDIELEIPSARLWTLEDPSLYSVVVQGEEFAHGLRRVSVRKNAFLLNGQPVILKGCLVDARDWQSKDMEERIEWMKEAGFTAVKSDKGPFPEAFLRICDKTGMLVAEEMEDESFDAFARCHPCLALNCRKESIARAGMSCVSKGNARMEKIVDEEGHALGVFMRASWDARGNMRQDAMLARAVLCHFEKPQVLVSFGKEEEGAASWTWHGKEGEHCRVKVFTAAPFAALLVNGKHVGAKAVKRHMAVFSLRHEPGELKIRSLDKRGELLGVTIMKTRQESCDVASIE